MNKFLVFIDIILVLVVLALAIWFALHGQPKGLESLINNFIQ